MADLSKIQLGNGEECNIKDAYARGKLANLFPFLVDAVAISSGDNLNTYTSPGVYYASSSVAGSLTNSNITTVPFKLFVMKAKSDSNALWQIELAAYENCIIAIRYSSNGGTSFASWRRITPTATT